jgi:hypothetical protein
LFSAGFTELFTIFAFDELEDLLQVKLGLEDLNNFISEKSEFDGL